MRITNQNTMQPALRVRAFAFRSLLCVLSFVVAFAIACVPTSGAYAADAALGIRYDGAQDSLTLQGATDADLFASFKNVVPGDVLTQDIAVDLTGITGETRVYVQAEADEATATALQDVQLTASFEDGSQTGTPASVFQDKALVLTASSDVSRTMRLTLAVPTTVGNELAAARETVRWTISVEEEDGTGDVSSVRLRALDLVAYEGGLGTQRSSETDGLPEPAWTVIGADSRVTVDGRSWDVSESGMPFSWYYFDVTSSLPVTESATTGVYGLRVVPLEGNPTVMVEGKRLELPDDGVVLAPDGSAATVTVREVTDDEAATSLDPSLYKLVYGSVAPALASSLSSSSSAAMLASEAEAVSFTEHGTAAGECQIDQPHAHVAEGTTFVRNGNQDLPVNDNAAVVLLWDDLIPEVLGSDAHMSALDAKSRAVVDEQFKDAATTDCSFAYLDLVDANDGNVWAATADESAVTVFVPYQGTMDADDEYAVVDFDGLTRDYTIGMEQADIDAEIAQAGACALEVTKASDGILFDVPYCGFGPFEIIWTDTAPGGQPADEPPSGGGVAKEATGLPSHTHVLASMAKTGDRSFAVAMGAAVAALAACLVLAAGFLARRKARAAGARR